MRYVSTLILILIMMQMPISAWSSADIDSLVIELKKMPDDTFKLKKVYDLAYQNFRNYSYKNYADLLLKEAEKQRNDNYKASALFLIGMYYYSKNGDSMRMVIDKVEPLLLAQNRIDEACRMRGWSIYNYSKEGYNEKVIPEVLYLKKMAQKYNYPEGEDMADQALAEYYCDEGLKKEGFELYEDVFARMEKRDAPLIKRVTAIRHMLNKNIYSDRQIYYLDKIKGYIRDCEAKGVDQIDAETSLWMLRYFYHRSSVLLAAGANDFSLMKTHLDEAEKIVNEEQLSREVPIVKQLKIAYYELTGKYDLAMQLNDELMVYYERSKLFDIVYDRILKKADLLNATGKTKEAASIYRSLIFQKDSARKAAFYDDLAKLRTQHDLDKLELRNKRMELEAVNSQHKMLLLMAGIVFLILICCMLVFIAYSRHKYGLDLKAAKEKAEEADRLKSAFLANMNHEIRTPLNAIVGFSQVLIEEEDRNAREKLAEIIQNNNELLQRLIADVLDISKIESNSMSFIYAEHDLPSLMKEIYKVILLRMPDQIELKLDECPSVLIEIDRNRLTQILTNLLTNAIKHTQKGFVRFGYTLVDSNVQFFVQDSGEGIPEEEQERIFSRFVQLNDWDKGVGLGLAICKGLIEKMGGSIAVTSKVGEGSIFYVVLPLKQKNSDNI